MEGIYSLMFGVNNSCFYGHDYSRDGLILNLSSDLATMSFYGNNLDPTNLWHDLTNNCPTGFSLDGFGYNSDSGWSITGTYPNVTFDGIDDQIFCAANPSNNIAGLGTLEIWANFHTANNNDGGNQLFLFSKINAFNICIGTFSQNGKPFFYDWTFGFRELYGTSVVDSQWHQHIITWSTGASELIYYLDTSQKNTVTYNITSNVGNLVIGNFTTVYNGHMRGKIASIKMYNKILTPSEINRNYKSGIR